jgi:putative transposase
VIRVLRPEFPALSVHRMSQLLGISRSLVYAPRKRQKPPDVLVAIEKLVVRFLGYGYRRVRRALQKDGMAVSEYEVRQVMREHGLMARRPRSRGVTRPSARERRAGNLLKGLRASAPNQIWVADTTLVRTASGPLYLAALMDLFSRKAVAWHLSRRNDEELVRECLLKALRARRPNLGWVHHSDQGSTYTAAGYTKLIRDAGGKCSFSAPGKPRENAHMESFFRTLKLEEVDRNRYESFLEAQASLERFIDTIYNQQRMHSQLEYMSPDQFESRQAGEAR